MAWLYCDCAAVGGCRPLVGTSVRCRMNSSTHGVALLRQAAVGRCRPLVDTSVRHRYPTPCRPTVGTHQQQRHAVPTDRGGLSKAGWVPLRGCERHGCRDQAPMGEGALLAKHCFASARTHSRQRLGRTPEGGLRRPPQPDPPRQPTESQLLTLTLLWLEAGAGLQALQNKTHLNRTSRLLPAHTTASHATPCQPHWASARLPSAPPAAMPMNMPVNSSALRRLRAGGTSP